MIPSHGLLWLHSHLRVKKARYSKSVTMVQKSSKLLFKIWCSFRLRKPRKRPCFFKEPWKGCPPWMVFLLFLGHFQGYQTGRLSDRPLTKKHFSHCENSFRMLFSAWNYKEVVYVHDRQKAENHYRQSSGEEYPTYGQLIYKLLLKNGGQHSPFSSRQTAEAAQCFHEPVKLPFWSARGRRIASFFLPQGLPPFTFMVTAQ